MRTAFMALIVIYAAVLFAYNLPRITAPEVIAPEMVTWLGEVRFELGGSTRISATAEAGGYLEGRGFAKHSQGYLRLLQLAQLAGLNMVVFVKVLPWLLALVALYYLFRIGELLSGIGAGFISCLLFLHCHYFKAVGVPADFAFPLLTSFVYFELSGRRRPMLAVLVIAGLFYGPALISCMALLAPWLIVRKEGGFALRWKGRQLAEFGVVLAFLFLLGLPALIQPAGGTKFISYEEALDELAPMDSGNIPEVDEGLYAEWLRKFLQVYWTGHFTLAAFQPLQVTGLSPLVRGEAWAKRIVPALGLLGFLLLLFILPAGHARPPPIVVHLLGSSAFLYLVALILAFLLFWPDRYVRYTVTLASLLYVGVVTDRGFACLGPAVRRVAPVGAAVVYLAVFGTGLRTTIGPNEDYRPAAALLHFLAETPPDSRVAGPLQLMDAVELVSDRETFIFCQIADGMMIFGGEMSDEVEARTEAWFRAYYALSGEVILEFMQDHDVDLFVVDRQLFEVELWDAAEDLCLGSYQIPIELLERPAIFEPFLRAPPMDSLVYNDGRFAVLSRPRLEEWLAGRRSTAIPR